ncbi:MAG: cysteine--tRNA ligase, partial [Clostridia bacterium]|nr:cysteine--tRNA ligase [Clostridia bacterium]
NEKELEFSNKLDQYKQKFIDAMDDDLNTADAIAAIFDIVYASNTDLSTDEKNSEEIINKALGVISELGEVLGLFNKSKSDSLDAEIEALIEERNKARQEKDWAKADEIRDKLKAMNIVLKDTPMGVKWSYEN